MIIESCSYCNGRHNREKCPVAPPTNYDESVRYKWICPPGYREIVPGEKLDKVYDRSSRNDGVRTEVELLNWEYPEQRHIRIKYNHAEMIVNACWYVAKIEKESN